MKKLRSELLKTIEPAIEFIKNIDGKVAIIHDDDADGICAGVLIGKLIPESKLFSTEWNVSLTDSIAKKINGEHADYVIIVDVPHADQQILNKIDAKILLIDHHVPGKYENIVYCNPRLFLKDIYWPTSYLCYHINERISGKKDFLWVAAAGTLGDHGIRDCKDVFEEMKNSELIKNFELKEDALYESKLGLITKIIDSGRVVKGHEGAEFVSNTLVKLGSWKDLLDGKSVETKKILGWYETDRKEFDRLVNDFEKNSKSISKNIVFYEFRSSLNLKSTLASAMGNKHKNKILVVAQESGNFFVVSLRRGDAVKTSLHNLFIKSTENIPGAEGGGHHEAVGGKIPKTSLDVFLRNLAVQ